MNQKKALVACALVVVGSVVGACGTSKKAPDNVGRKEIVCTDGHKITITENTRFYPGKGIKGPSYTVGVRIKDGVMRATILGGDKEGGISRLLVAGESVTHEGVGTFTLMSVSPRDNVDGRVGGGGTAEFCFVPAPGFVVDDFLQQTNEKGK